MILSRHRRYISHEPIDSSYDSFHINCHGITGMSNYDDVYGLLVSQG